MPDLIEITADELEVGKQVTAWMLPDGYSGSGGTITRIAESFLELEGGTDRVFKRILFAEVHHFTEERMLDASECLEFHTGECRGVVDYCPTPPFGERALPRCEHHNEQRWDRYERSETEKYAHSDVAPSDFHRGWGGANEYGEHFYEEDY